MNQATSIPLEDDVAHDFLLVGAHNPHVGVVRVFRPVEGDVLDLEVEIIRTRGPVGTGKCLATVDGEKAVSCEITFIVADADKK